MDQAHTSDWQSPKVILTILAMLLLTSVVIVSIIRDRIVSQQQWTVTVNGQGKVPYQPDIAKITLGVQIDKVPKADQALQQLNDKIGKVLAAVKAAGIPEEDIQTQNYVLYPQYDAIDNTSVVSGYGANQQLLVKVKNITQNSDAVSKIIAEATKAGANQIAGVTFDSSKLEELKQQARLLAIADARGKADGLATAASVRLGKVVGWWENLVQIPGSQSMDAYGKGGAGGGAPVVPTGGQEIIIEIGINYRIK